MFNTTTVYLKVCVVTFYSFQIIVRGAVVCKWVPSFVEVAFLVGSEHGASQYKCVIEEWERVIKSKING